MKVRSIAILDLWKWNVSIEVAPQCSEHSSRRLTIFEACEVERNLIKVCVIIKNIIEYLREMNRVKSRSLLYSSLFYIKVQCKNYVQMIRSMI